MSLLYAIGVGALANVAIAILGRLLRLANIRFDPSGESLVIGIAAAVIVASFGLAARRELLRLALLDAHGDDPEFGYRFLADELVHAGLAAGERRVWRLCSQQQIWSSTVRKGRRGSGKTPGPAVHDDHVNRDFTATEPDQVWLTDELVQIPGPHARGERLPFGHQTDSAPGPPPPGARIPL